MENSLELVKLILQVVQVLVIPFLVWQFRKFRELDCKHEALRVRMAAVETTLKEMPTAQGVHEITLAIERLRGDVRASNEKHESLEKLVVRLERVIERQENYMLSGGK
ncbi:MAG: DUF2730 family protein [Desulfovibrio sp.]